MVELAEKQVLARFLPEYARVRNWSGKSALLLLTSDRRAENLPN